MPSVSFKKEVAVVSNIEILNDSSLNRYDEVDVSVDIFNKLYPNFDHEQQDNNLYVVIRLLGSEYLNDLKIYEISSIDYSASNLVRFINNSSFLQYNNQITVTSCLVKSVDMTHIPLLTKIYIAIPESIYSILSGDTQDSLRSKFANKLFKSKAINQGDIIRSINGEVKLIEPLKQGFWNLNTDIILIKHNIKEDELPDNIIEESSDDIIEEEPDFELNLSSYLSSELYVTSKKHFSIRPLPENIPIDNFPSYWLKEDNEFFIFANSVDLINLNFPIFNGDAVKIVYGDSNYELIVRIFTFIEPNHFEVGVVYLSPILLINLNIGEASTIQIQPIANKSSESLSSLIPIANNVTISRIASSITMDKIYQQHFFSNLKYLLNDKLRCVRNGDFIPVKVDSILSKTMFDLDFGDENDTIPMGNPDSIAWFKIIDINGQDSIETGQFIIDPLKTKLISSGIEYIKLPPNEFYNWYHYLKLPPIFNYNVFSGDISNFKYAKEFKKIILTSFNSKISLHTIVLLNSLSRGIGKANLVRNMSNELGINLIELDCNELINPGQELKTVGLLSGKIDKIINNFPPTSSGRNIIFLRHIESLCIETNANEQNSNVHTSISLKINKLLKDYLHSYPRMVIVLSCNDYDKLNNNIKNIVKFKIDINIPSELERAEILKFLIQNQLNKNPNSADFQYVPRNDIDYRTLAVQSAGLSPLDLISIVNDSKKFAVQRLRKLSMNMNIPFRKLIEIGNGGSIILIPEDFSISINEARNQFSDSIGAPKIPNVKWEDIGGLDVVKDEILDTIDMPLKYPELFNNGLKKRSGVLFYGPPGTGKTLLAKAIASNFSLNFFSVKGPELLNMYIGESEANVRKVFQRARDAKPCVIFFDELDSVAPKRGNQGDSGGVMDRIVSQLLAELDGMSSSDGEGVFVVGATNRPDLLDEALLRPGRFDKMLYLGISDTDEKQFKILEALTRKFKLHDDVDLYKVAEKCSFTLTGADFYALCSDAMLNAMTRISLETDKKVKDYNARLTQEGEEQVSTRWWFDNVATEDDTAVTVTLQDFEKSQSSLVPSVSADELNHYLRIRQNFEGSKEEASQLANQMENGNI